MRPTPYIYRGPKFPLSRPSNSAGSILLSRPRHGVDFQPFARRIAGVGNDHVAFLQSGKHFNPVAEIAAHFHGCR